MPPVQETGTSVNRMLVPPTSPSRSWRAPPSSDIAQVKREGNKRVTRSLTSWVTSWDFASGRLDLD